MKRIDTQNKYRCCGCTACASICPTNAITMVADALGFLYPTINNNLCINCGKCKDVCQFKPTYNRSDNLNEPLVYGVRHKKQEELSKSQSGAASWAIIETFLKESCIVYGAMFESAFHVVHKRVLSIEDAQRFRGSKYIQSDLRGSFTDIKEDLRNGKEVLFIGSGCQVAGLKSYIPANLRERLLTVDIVCHAAPSPSVWRNYIEYIEKKYHSIVITANFRDKKYGWHSHKETFRLANGIEFESELFKYLFYDHVIIRKSCTECPFANTMRVSDLTIGDFWGWEEHHKEWNDNKGVSLLLVNTNKGRRFFEKLKNRVEFINSDISQCLQPQLISPSKAKKSQLDKAEYIFKKGGFEALIKTYSHNSLKWKLVHLFPKLRRSLEYRIKYIRRVFSNKV